MVELWFYGILYAIGNLNSIAEKRKASNIAPNVPRDWNSNAIDSHSASKNFI